MKIYVDDVMPYATEFFRDLGEVVPFSGRKVEPGQLDDADILLVRSVTKVNSALLAGNQRLKFVGTATIGTDHLDTNYLKARGIPFSNAPGCNAQSVVEYVLSCLFLLSEIRQQAMQSWTVGVVGVGQIGRRLVKALTALEVKVLQCDPLRAAAEPDFLQVPFAELSQQVDVLCLHVPLVRDGEHATYHLLNETALQALPSHVAIINACRGEVIDNRALLKHQQQMPRDLFLDTWEGEPAILQELVPHCHIATAHIAGHSIEGKARGTEMLYQMVCQLLGKTPQWQLADFCPSPIMENLQISADFRLSDVQNLCRMLYDVRRDDALFRFYLATRGFDWLRKTYPPRREFASLQLSGHAIPDFLVQLGFKRQQ